VIPTIVELQFKFKICVFGAIGIDSYQSGAPLATGSAAAFCSTGQAQKRAWKQDGLE